MPFICRCHNTFANTKKTRTIVFLLRTQISLAWISFLWTLITSASASKSRTLYLNSLESCDLNQSFPVTKHLMYKIEADENPKEQSFLARECIMTFHAEGTDAKICVIQDYLDTVLLTDDNVVLTVRDSTDDMDDALFEVDVDHPLTDLEYCTNTPNLYVNLRRKERWLRVNMKDLHISLKVVHKSSRERQFYLDYYICWGTISLENSEVIVYNRRDPTYFKANPTNLAQRCGVYFIKDPPSTNTTLCIVYLPQGIPNCNSMWTLYITDGTVSTDAPYVLYKLDCKADPKAKEKHAWCAPDTLHRIFILHMRNPGGLTNSTVGWPMQYHLLVTDDRGGDVEKLLRRFEEKMPPGGAGKNGHTYLFIWLLVSLAIVTFSAVLIILVATKFSNRPVSCENEAPIRPASIAQMDGDTKEDVGDDEDPSEVGTAV